MKTIGLVVLISALSVHAFALDPFLQAQGYTSAAADEGDFHSEGNSGLLFSDPFASARTGQTKDFAKGTISTFSYATAEYGKLTYKVQLDLNRTALYGQFNASYGIVGGGDLARSYDKLTVPAECTVRFYNYVHASSGNVGGSTYGGAVSNRLLLKDQALFTSLIDDIESVAFGTEATLNPYFDVVLEPGVKYEYYTGLTSSGGVVLSSIGTASFSVDASHTGGTWFESLTPGVSPTTWSGAVYRSLSVPEPASMVGLVAAGLGILVRRRKRG